eukprot:gnl/MRDRNA2_/MRDRNA2_96153_c0_seq1.p1 gnl/MRDRNA2_/MRDRNA2_96153_c0~~gnl/MRDRNA2_/MRDRNA2_96153_c0_seq1.p1  ORF type:complete len:235 (-),score=58.33 gnl/MRDRNA2_/MRDRNA2_96153_c0_seq1:5-709(-)
MSQSSALAIQLPLSDHCLDLKIANKALSSAQTREKSLKILQYSAKLFEYLLARSFKDSVWKKHWGTLAKTLSTARRFFKFNRWLKHLEDVDEAKAEKAKQWRNLLMFDIVCNIGADIAEDITSLEKVGIVPKGVLPARTEYYANWCQLVLAIVEIIVSGAKCKREREKKAKDPATLATSRKSAMADLEFSKFIADLGKAFYDCELSFASEFVFILCGLWAALVSTHKYLLRALK